MLAKVNRNILILFFIVFTSFKTTRAQYAITAKYFGMTIHPFGDSYAYLQPYRLDKNARFVLNFGAFIGVERFLSNPRFSIKAIQAGFLDCSGGWAGFSHLGFRSLVFEKGKHSYHLGLGPVFLYRQSWTRFGSDYKGSSFFRIYNSNHLGPVQYKFLISGIDMEYDYKLNDRNRLSASITPGFPMAIIFSVGWKGFIGQISTDHGAKIYVPRK
ncbi:MAG: hypothetical protein KJ941_01775 [Bacteroidetes bacterium]|nr:hypothetical protein [Bacteroidota bacterium]